MGFFSRLFGKSEQRYNLENPQVALTGGSLAMVGYGGPTAPSPFGVITPAIAEQFSAYHCAVRIIAETMASLPLILYRRTKEGKVRATDHPVYPLLTSRPNDVMTSFTWREILITSAINQGDAYTYIETNKKGQVINLLPLAAQNVETHLLDGRKFFVVKTGVNGTGPKYNVAAEEMLHIMGETVDGIRGMPIITYIRNTVGLALAAEHHGMQFFAQGTTPSGVLEFPRQLTDKARQSLVQSWSQAYAGIKGAHRVPILEDGLKFTPISLTNEDSQWIASRTFQVQEIARWFRIPGHMIGELSRSTNNNVEQQHLEFAQLCIRPWAERIEAELETKLLLPSEREDYFIEFLMEGLVRADLKTRMAAYAIGRQWGIYSANDCRDMENLNRYEGGDIYLSPLNMVDASALPLDPVPGGQLDAPLALPKGPNDDDPTDDQDLHEVGRSLPLLASLPRILDAGALALSDPLTRLAQKESKASQSASFNPQEFYGKHETLLTQAIQPALRSLAGTIAAVRNLDAKTAQQAADLVGETEAKRYCASRLADGHAYDAAALAKEWAEKVEKLLRIT